jgi:hypothetical protein
VTAVRVAEGTRRIMKRIATSHFGYASSRFHASMTRRISPIWLKAQHNNTVRCRTAERIRILSYQAPKIEKI